MKTCIQFSKKKEKKSKNLNSISKKLPIHIFTVTHKNFKVKKIIKFSASAAIKLLKAFAYPHKQNMKHKSIKIVLTLKYHKKQ